jgi:excisionase family DNA binding protein
MSTAKDKQLTVEEVAKLDKTFPETVRRQIKRGELPAVHIGRLLRRVWASEWRKARRSSRTRRRHGRG